MAKIDLTAERVRELFDYNQDTGVFTWKMRLTNRTKIGDIVGSIKKSGHISTSVANTDLYLHRVAWLYVYGRWPSNEIDHIDGDKTNNAISNLRDVPHYINAQNLIHPRKGNLYGTSGVSKCYKKWLATITVSGKSIRLGSFDCIEDAHAAYIAGKRIYHEGCTI